MFIFLSWSVVLLYLLIGPIYRVSLMGAFTSPLAFVLQAFALLAINDAPVQSLVHPNPWLELHAAISVVAYGAYALAAVAGVMYLMQERKLKTHHLGTVFFNMPPIADLAAVINRLLWAGSALLTVGILSGFAVGAPPLKIAWGVSVWLIFSAILLAEKLRRISPRRVAIVSVAAFVLTLATLWGINFIGANGRL